MLGEISYVRLDSVRVLGFGFGSGSVSGLGSGSGAW